VMCIASSTSSSTQACGKQSKDACSCGRPMLWCCVDAEKVCRDSLSAAADGYDATTIVCVLPFLTDGGIHSRPCGVAAWPARSRRIGKSASSKTTAKKSVNSVIQKRKSKKKME
jgi:hypothetical protein